MICPVHAQPAGIGAAVAYATVPWESRAENACSARRLSLALTVISDDNITIRLAQSSQARNVNDLHSRIRKICIFLGEILKSGFLLTILRHLRGILNTPR
jgi:hypothetical protein